MSKTKQWKQGHEKVSDDIINSYVKGEINFNNAKDKLSNVDNIELCGIDEYNVDEVLFIVKKITGKSKCDRSGTMSKDGTIHLVYQRQYYDERGMITSLSILLYSEMSRYLN